MRDLDRWATKHYTLASRMQTLLWAGLAAAGVIAWHWHILVALLVYLAGTVVSSLLLFNCGERLRREPIAMLNQQCDPYPLLVEMREQLSYSLPPIQMLVTEVNYALALGSTGEYEEAYQRLNSINIDHPRISPNVKVAYYSNRADLCFLMGKYPETVSCYEKALQIFDSMKPGKAKEKLRYAVESNCGMYHFCREEYDAALRVMKETQPQNLRHRVSLAMTGARILLAKGEKEKAREQLQFVVDNGNQMVHVTQARNLLAENNMEE